MASASIYLDEDVHTFVADALRLRGWEALTTYEVERTGTDDLSQLQFAASGGDALLTYNVQYFPCPHYEARTHGETHADIIVATQDDPKRSVRALLNLVNLMTAEELAGELIYLSGWA